MMLLSAGQVSFFLSFALAVALYVVAEATHRLASPSKHALYDQLEVEEGLAHKKDETLPATPARNVHSSMWKSMMHSGFVRCLVLDQQALLEHRLTLRASVEWGCLLSLYFICDRTTIFQTSEKTYSRDLFMFLFLVLTCVAIGASRQAVKAPLVLNRQQTEEWKGWMQVLFLLYHYFEARELYNAIRVFIAGYVWMTGYGNFSYYYRTSDFGIGRFCQMMWRLNFLVFFSCLVLDNSYMLYYICPMHTIFTVFVYAVLAIGSQHNKSHVVIIGKLVLSVVAIEILWNKTVFYTTWTPFKILVGYLDPRKPDLTDALHEWYFRSSLDRYVWIWGMVCAYVHPLLTKMYSAIDTLPSARRWTVSLFFKAIVVKLLLAWYFVVYTKPKLRYNQIHPYTSWIPITGFFLLRNMTPGLRTWNMRLYGWLGCITLETYISQFHIWLHTGIANGQPKLLLCLIPGYPMLNFALCTALYVWLSHRLFQVTNDLKNAVVPHDDNRVLLRNGVMMLVGGVGMYMLARVVQGMMYVV